MKKLLSLTLLCSATIGLAMEKAEHTEATTKTPTANSSIFGIVYKQVAGNPARLQTALAIIMENDMEKEETQTALLKTLQFNDKSAPTLFNLCNNNTINA